MEDIEYRTNTASRQEIISHLSSCGEEFYLALTARVDIPAYADKLIDKAVRFEAWDGATLVGLLSVYHNENGPFDFISNLSITENFQGRGIAFDLLKQGIELAGEKGEVRLEVGKGNDKAIKFYRTAGFHTISEAEDSYTMTNKAEQSA